MNDILMFIDELVMLQKLNKDPKVDLAIQHLLDKYLEEVREFEASIEMDFVRYYNPMAEV